MPSKSRKTRKKTRAKKTAVNHNQVIMYIVLLVMIVSIAGGVFWKIKSDQKARLLERQNIIKAKLTDMLEIKTLSQSFQYRDEQDKSKVINIVMQNNFANPRRPETRGTITVSYLENAEEKRQTAEFITSKAKDLGDNIYLRITEGRELTNAPEGWYYADAFATLQDVPGFKNFWYFSYDKLNQIQGYVVTGSLRDSQEKDKIIQEIAEGKTYTLKSCSQKGEEITCSGDIIPDGIRSIDTNVAISEGLSSNNFGNAGATPYASSVTFVADQNQKGIKRLELGNGGNGNPLTIHYTNIDQPFNLDLPKDYYKLTNTR